MPQYGHFPLTPLLSASQKYAEYFFSHLGHLYIISVPIINFLLHILQYTVSHPKCPYAFEPLILILTLDHNSLPKELTYIFILSVIPLSALKEFIV